MTALRTQARGLMLGARAVDYPNSQDLGLAIGL